MKYVYKREQTRGRTDGWMDDGLGEWKGSAFVFVVNDVRKEDRIRYDNLEKKSFGWTAS